MKKIAEAVIELLTDQRMKLETEAARARLLTEYSTEQISTLLKLFYARAVNA